MYTLYTDKQEDFKCNIGLEGAKLSETKARLVLKSSNISLLFEGTVDPNGTCEIPISKLKNILESGTKGDITLEVIAEDTFFSPWKDKFEVKASKSVKVEVQNSTQNPLLKEKIEVSVVIPKNHGKFICEILSKNGIDLMNLDKNKKIVDKIIEMYTTKHKIKDHQQVIEDIITHLTNQI